MSKLGNSLLLKRALILVMFVVMLCGNVKPANAASYTSKTFTHVFYFEISGKYIAEITEKTTIYFYTDGKVHIYSEDLSIYSFSSLYTCSVSKPVITNTDGSYSKVLSTVQVTNLLGTTYSGQVFTDIKSGNTIPSSSFSR